MEHRRIFGASQLEEELAARIKHESFERRKLCYPWSRLFKCSVEDSEGNETGRISVLLVVGVKNIDKDT